MKIKHGHSGRKCARLRLSEWIERKEENYRINYLNLIICILSRAMRQHVKWFSQQNQYNQVHFVFKWISSFQFNNKTMGISDEILNCTGISRNKTRKNGESREKWRERESEWDYFWHQFKYFKRLNGSCELELNHNTREKARMAVARAKDMK